MYVHGGGIDQPIAVVRSEYSDSLHTGVVYPFANHKGQYDMGINPCVLVQPRSPLLAEHHGEQQIGTDTVRHQIADTQPYEHCIRVEWPGRRSFSSGERRHLWGPAPPWVGSLLYHGKDPSGQMYRRNRFYDPASGRFTQEDPIGIAGGLNVYGYANGDPISFADPYGLSADTLRYNGSTLTWHADDGTVLGSWPATSGRPGTTAADQARSNVGPIPEGTYSINPSEVFNERGLAKAIFRLRTGFADYGDYRTPLTRTGGSAGAHRSSFWLHGGSTPGSAGCIDVGAAQHQVFSLIQSSSGPLTVVVQYPSTKTVTTPAVQLRPGGNSRIPGDRWRN